MRLNWRVREIARLYVQAGLSVIPIRMDGSKSPPPISWKPWQRRRPSAYQIDQYFRNDVGVAILGGEVSGKLEIIDFDRANLVIPWIAIVEGKAQGLVARLPRIKTPKGGSHFYYRCDEIKGNEKLAQEPPAIDQATGEPVPNTLIETRGEGGYVLAPGSPPECHPRKATYDHVEGPPLTEIPRVTVEERKILLDAARSFNKWTPEIVDHRQSRFVLDGDRTRPGDDYNSRASWQDVLGPAGWTIEQSRGEIVHWRRPGKTDRGTSATTGHCGDCLYVFSSNAAPFSPGTGYTKFCAYALINHSGDFSAAAKALEQAGYGNLESARAEVAEFEKATNGNGVQMEDSKGLGSSLMTPQKDYSKKKKKKPSDVSRFFDGRTFLPEPLAIELCSKYKFIATPKGDDGLGVRVYIYRDGSFKPGGEDIIVTESRNTLGNLSNENRAKEVVKNIRISEKIEYERLNHKSQTLINVKNGMLDWKEGKLLPHDQEYLSTIQIDANFDPKAQSDLLDKFFESILPADEIPVVEEFIGYLLIPDTSFNKCLVFVGEGGNGKTQFMDLIMGLLGEKNISHYSLQHISEEKFSISGLFGSLANFYDELQTKQIKDTATFKMVTGGSPIKAEDKGKAPFSFRPFCRLVFSANEMPKSDDRSQAYFDRFIFIQLPNRIRETKKEIRKYASVLLATPGVKEALLNRAVNGLRRLMSQGRFSASTSSAAAIEEYRRECNSSYDFAKECFSFEDPTAWLPKKDVYFRYRMWCSESGRKPMSERGFSKGLEAMNVRSIRHKDARGWGGISWANGEPPKSSSDEVKDFKEAVRDVEDGEQRNLDF